MSRWRAGAALLASGFLMIVIAAVSAPLASAQPVGQPVPPVAGAQSLMELEIDQLIPRLVTAATPTVTVTGTVTNTGDRRVDNIQV
ncbi:MAG: hypothetical protein LC635_02440, partial [Pseudonocardiaceae bacterium]|nr:hypothetical protein [Pseudonocardiaceae bacterium]